MPPLTIDGVVHPDEYEVRVDGPGHPVVAQPAAGRVFIEVYYSFDGSALHFGVRRTQPVRISGISIWVDPDRNGCELGDLLVAVEPEHRLATYGIFTAPGQVDSVAGSPPDPARAGVEVRSFADGDTEVKIALANLYAHGLKPNPLPNEMNVNVTATATDASGAKLVNYLRDAPIQTFVIAFE
jgi:hypothetical protein